MTASMPKLSFLTATRDRPRYLAEAIASIEAQTDGDWEHLVCANGPRTRTDGTLDVLQEAIARNPTRFRYEIADDQEDRPARYWNRLVRLARGRYLTLADDDNRKAPDFIAKMTAPMEQDFSVHVVTCGWHYIDAAGDRLDRPDDHANLMTDQKLRTENTVDGGALAFRASVIEQIGIVDESGQTGLFSERLRTCEDWHLVIRLIRAFRAVHLPDVLLQYRVHDGMRTMRAQELGVDTDRHACAELWRCAL